MAAQKRNIMELRVLWHMLGKPPLLVPGDIFNKWNSVPEIVNFAIREMPSCYAVPGNHDLPYHDYKSLDKSAYATLMEADKVTNLEPGKATYVGGETPIWLHGFPHGFSIGPRAAGIAYSDLKSALHIAVIHQYLWSNKDNRHPQAEKDSHVSALNKKLKKYGYDVAVVGDNHQHFYDRQNDVSILNCGYFIPRITNERTMPPSIGLIHSDGTITRHYLDITKDLWNSDEFLKNKEVNPDSADAVINSLTKLAESGLSFRETLVRFMRRKGLDVPSPVKKILLEVMEDL